MTDAERQELVDAAADVPVEASPTIARSVTRKASSMRVAHGADFALQLALNPAITKPQLDKLLTGDRDCRSRRGDPGVAYWAGEPDRLARAVVFIAQRKLHTDAEWKAWFASRDESQADRRRGMWRSGPRLASGSITMSARFS